MSSRKRPLSRILGASALLLSATQANAQADLEVTPPNVLLLVDTSGSMEYKVDGQLPKCETSTSDEKSRWIDLLEVLTGEIEGYRCQKVDRTDPSTSGVSFLWDYARSSWGTSYGKPADYLYELPYHRPLSYDSTGGCAVLPGELPAPYQFPSDAIRYRYRAPDSALGNDCTFNQKKDGILDTFAGLVRFGLMTFDPETDPATGIVAGGLDYQAGAKGGWTYRVGDGDDDIPTGKPANCLEPPAGPGSQPYDPGARNAAAPPWEGRMVAFGNPSATRQEALAKIDQIEKVLLTTRPYGGTPIAGMLKDAYDFFVEDTQKDPLHTPASGETQRDFGPRSDPYVTGGCRKQSVVLLTDGRPNLDLEPFCSEKGNPDGKCPFLPPEATAAELVKQGIDTFVIAFALPTFDVGGVARACNAPEVTSEVLTTLCADPTRVDDQGLQACCVLNRIAVSGARKEKFPFYPGKKPKPFFANGQEDLAQALSSVLSSTLNVTSRTQPVIAGASNGSSGMRFFSFVQPRPLAPWVGSIRRQRWRCNGTTAEPIEIEPELGDDFATNLALGKDKRLFVTLEGRTSDADFMSPGRTLRPHLTSAPADGLGRTGVHPISKLKGEFPQAVSPKSLEFTDGPYCNQEQYENLCRDNRLKWLVGDTADDVSGAKYSRCDETGCHLLGDALHSTPVVVGPPAALVRDETYAAFALEKRWRPIVLYASTNDGFLHAFRVGTTKQDTETEKVSDQEKALEDDNNELWAFIPPAVLPDLRKQYPFNHLPLLDGTPVVKDVVATIVGEGEEKTIHLERAQSDAMSGKGSYRTVLVQSLGPTRAGYFAVDITDPVPKAGDANSGPRFLWQLTTTIPEEQTEPAAPQDLFGKHGATPLITTLYFDPTGGSNPKEIPVAILPGGSTSPRSTSAGCATSSLTGFEPIDSAEKHKAVPRPHVRCYTEPEELAARSLTVVRLDTGEIIRTFRPEGVSVPGIADGTNGVITRAPLDSPISGQPVAFPAEVGAVADRVYVGDQDGRLWRVDFSQTNPKDWRMQLFFDAFPEQVGGKSLHSGSNAWRAGQPIVLPPVLSVDGVGNVTLNIATGDQETLLPDEGVTNYVWSLTEQTGENHSQMLAAVNWYQPLGTGERHGERVVGPLTLFNSQLFFTTYTPAATGAVCSPGLSRVWGMDYIRPNPGEATTSEEEAESSDAEESATIDKGGHPRLRVDDEPEPEQFLEAKDVTGDPNAIVFGLSVAQQPTCSADVTGTSAANPFFGNSSTLPIQNVNPGRFELVMHKGGTAGLSSSGSVEETVHVMPLTAPPSAARIDSWAALLE